MTTLATRLHRLVLHLYPARFRRDFGADMAGLLADRHRHEGRAEWRILLDEIVDAARAAPRMRWESPMNRIAIIAVTGTAALAALLVAQLALIPVAILGVAAWFAWGRPLQPIAPTPVSHRWVPWSIAGAFAIATAVAIPAIDGGELSSLWWTVMALALLAGIAMTIAGALIALDVRTHHAAPPTHP